MSGTPVWSCQSIPSFTRFARPLGRRCPAAEIPRGGVARLPSRDDRSVRELGHKRDVGGMFVRTWMRAHTNSREAASYTTSPGGSPTRTVRHATGTHRRVLQLIFCRVLRCGLIGVQYVNWTRGSQPLIQTRVGLVPGAPKLWFWTDDSSHKR